MFWCLDFSNRSFWYTFNLRGNHADSKHIADAVAIRRLYFHGPCHPGSFDVHGRYTIKALGLSAYTLKHLRESMKAVVTAVQEFSQDILRGEITDALRGRHTSNLRAYEAARISTRKGDRISHFLLPFHRKVLSLSDEEAHEVLVRVINRRMGSEG
jgi:hypothetical protein